VSSALAKESQWNHISILECNDLGGTRLTKVDILPKLVVDDIARSDRDDLGKIVLVAVSTTRLKSDSVERTLPSPSSILTPTSISCRPAAEASVTS
jgi:hypothetical protein